jgi:hypothetical protein
LLPFKQMENLSIRTNDQWCILRGFGREETGFQMTDGGFWIPDAGEQILDPGPLTLNFKSDPILEFHRITIDQ